jgi:hypothetical protein
MGRKRARTDSGSAPDEMGRELTCLESGPRPTCTGTLAWKQRRSHSESFGQVVWSRVLGTGVGEEAYTAAVTGPLAAVISSASERSRTMQRTAPLTMDGSCRARGGEASIYEVDLNAGQHVPDSVVIQIYLRLSRRRGSSELAGAQYYCPLDQP